MIRTLAATVLLLSGVAAVAAPPKERDAHEKSSDNADKMICKRFATTGSLVQSQRVCKTKREWERERDALRVTNSTNACANLGTQDTC